MYKMTTNGDVGREVIEDAGLDDDVLSPYDRAGHRQGHEE